MKVSLVIPCYNENNRILPVINTAKKIKEISEIIVIDDGSDNATKSILKKIPGIKIIAHPQNLGKTAALKTGVVRSSGDIIVFLDADLTGLKTNHVKNLIKPVITSQADINLSLRDSQYYRIFHDGFVTAYTGDRCLRKVLLMDNIDIFEVTGYLFEAAFNQRFFNSPLKIIRTRFNGVSHTPKGEKSNPVTGFIDDVKMALRILRYLGPKKLFFQTNFCRRLPLIS